MRVSPLSLLQASVFICLASGCTETTNDGATSAVMSSAPGDSAPDSVVAGNSGAGTGTTTSEAATTKPSSVSSDDADDAPGSPGSNSAGDDATPADPPLDDSPADDADVDDSATTDDATTDDSSATDDSTTDDSSATDDTDDNSATDDTALDDSSTTDDGSNSDDGSASSDDGSTDDGIVFPDADCAELVSNPNVNWRESSLQTDQAIVECLATSLGSPVGYGENALGGYDPNGASRLTVITKGGSLSPEEQIAEVVSSDEHHWIVFDKDDFSTPSEVALYRLQCADPSVQSALGITSPETCVDYEAWCTNNALTGNACLETFFNERLNDGDLPIRNLRIGSNTTIDGRQSQAQFLFSGFQIGSDSSGEPVETASSVILTHLRFQGAGHTEDHGLDPDMIRSTGASHDIWIHKNTFDLTGDSAFDVKVGAYDITMSFNLVQNVKRAALHGSSDSREINEQITTTMHHNLFVTTDDQYDELGNTGRRVPLIRRGRSHMFNNVFYNYRKDVLSVRVGAEVAFEDNAFLANPAAAGDDDIEYYVENLLRDFQEGGLEIAGSFVWYSDANFTLDSSARGDLTASHGSTSDMFAEYSERSRTTISAARREAGQELVDYVLDTAGRDGDVPLNSPLAAEAP